MNSENTPMQSITATELKQRLDNGEDVQIVDVREANEVAIGRIPNSIHIPLAQVLERMSEIDPSRDTVVHCKIAAQRVHGKLVEFDGRNYCLVQRSRSQRAEILTSPDRSHYLPNFVAKETLPRARVRASLAVDCRPVAVSSRANG